MNIYRLLILILFSLSGTTVQSGINHTPHTVIVGSVLNEEHIRSISVRYPDYALELLDATEAYHQFEQAVFPQSQGRAEGILSQLKKKEQQLREVHDIARQNKILLNIASLISILFAVLPFNYQKLYKRLIYSKKEEHHC